jgi:hypothetical protein
MYPLFLPDSIKLEFFREKKEAQISNFKKIRPVVAVLFHAGGQTEGRMEDGQT